MNMISAKKARRIALDNLVLTMAAHDQVDQISKMIYEQSKLGNTNITVNITWNVSDNDVRSVFAYFKLQGFTITKTPKQPSKGFMVEYPRLYTFSWV